MNATTTLRTPLLVLLLLLAFPPGTAAEGTKDLVGSWQLLRDQSTDVDHFRDLVIELRESGDGLTFVHAWRSRVSVRDSFVVVPGGKPTVLTVQGWVYPWNVFMGVRRVEGSKRTIAARWEKEGETLRLDEEVELTGSQGRERATAIHRYRLREGKEVMEYTVERSTRKSGPPMTYLFKRAGTRQAFIVRTGENWESTGGLPVNAFLISLQGLANRTAPQVYILYPDNWEFTYVNSVYEFYKNRKHFTFRELRGPAEALRALRQYVRGYVVWDPAVRTSLAVAYTVAGLEDAVVVTEELIPIAEGAGLKPVEDFRMKFRGWTDAQIYAWAADRYWARCSKEYIVWLGGEAGKVMKPAIADWGIVQRVFFNDLSTRVTDTAEYALAKRLLGEMKPMSMVMGWHSYAKDLEEEHVSLTSSFGHRVEGLITLPNLSFSSRIQVSPGFTYRNNHRLAPGERPVPEEKVYVTCIQTDGIGLGAWMKPGRGEIPYAWEVLMNYSWMAPGMAEYFYTMATPNDYFIGCLSGPGYLYPKAVPPKFLPKLIEMTREQMKTLDLRVFETMDWSEGSEVEGNTDLTRSIMDQYTKGLPEAIGFVNGYGPGHTFALRDGKPWVSYDYYLSPSRPEADAVADLQELARINSRRPYFLLLHIREYSDVKRVKGILDKLGPGFEVVPLDRFLAMAAAKPTFEERMLDK